MKTKLEQAFAELYNAVEHEKATPHPTKEETETFYQKLVELIYSELLEPLRW